MDYHINEFFHRHSEESPRGHFFDVIPLHEKNDISWAELFEKVPKISKAWYELSRISSKDRIEFTCDHWCDALPINPRAIHSIQHFFESLDDIGIYLVKCGKEDPFDVQMVYSVKDNGGFYRGALPADEKSLAALQKAFAQYTLPVDYLAFLALHDGFWKTTDCTGITISKNMLKKYEQFQEMLAKEPLTLSKGEAVNPKNLIPFYESFGMPYYQCFWGDWYPEQEMGNVYYSSETKTISNTKSNDPATETMAFPTFVDWLAFYLERID